MISMVSIVVSMVSILYYPSVTAKTTHADS